MFFYLIFCVSAIFLAEHILIKEPVLDKDYEGLAIVKLVVVGVPVVIGIIFFKPALIMLGIMTVVVKSVITATIRFSKKKA